MCGFVVAFCFLTVFVACFQESILLSDHSVFAPRYSTGLHEARVNGSLVVGADFQEGDEGSNFSVFRVRRSTEWPGPLH